MVEAHRILASHPETRRCPGSTGCIVAHHAMNKNKDQDLCKEIERSIKQTI